MSRPTNTLNRAQGLARSPGDALELEELGSARLTRHSFVRSFLRSASRERWNISRECFDIDDAGRGEAVYRVEAGTHHFRFVVFSTCIEESERTDRVIADSWDVTAALIDGPLSEARMEELRRQVPRQEDGRADASTLVWTRGNRSSRYFDYVVDCLARGQQPDVAAMGDATYTLRSTAFYANGKWGLADYGHMPEGHPLHLPYRAQMLAAFLLREFSYDLVERCAAARSGQAVSLAGPWRRYLGLGNATGLGMVPYVINHPRILDAWVALRELPLAYALEQSTPEVWCRIAPSMTRRLRRAIAYFREKTAVETAPYVSLPELATQLEQLPLPIEAGELAAGCSHVASSGAACLQAAAAAMSREARQVVDTLLVECFPEIDEDVEALLVCDEPASGPLKETCTALLRELGSRYAWLDRYDFDRPASSHYFWFFSEASQEPRRGERGVDPGEGLEMPIGIARDIQALIGELRHVPGELTVAEFVVDHPWHRGVLERVRALADVPYSEVPANLLDRDFVPLHLQRFQLAVYGAENFSPMSTDWLRVTFFSGAPRAVDLSSGVDDDWLFTPKPRPASTGVAQP